MKYTKADIFRIKDAGYWVVNPVNTVGVSGKGLALAFKNKYMSSYYKYKNACDNKTISTSKVFIDETEKIVYFATKEHWRNNSEIEYIVNGLKDLRIQAERLNIKTIAMPKIGCGLGGLDFKKDVLDLIKDEFDDTGIEIIVSLY